MAWNGLVDLSGVVFADFGECGVVAAAVAAVVVLEEGSGF